MPAMEEVILIAGTTEVNALMIPMLALLLLPVTEQPKMRKHVSKQTEVLNG